VNGGCAGRYKELGGGSGGGRGGRGGERGGLSGEKGS